MAKLVYLLISAFTTFIYYYFALPPINLTSGMFWLGVFIFLGVFFFLLSFEAEYRGEGETLRNVIGGVIALLLVVVVIGGIGSWEFFNAKKYQKLLTVEESSFEEDISQIEITQVPVMDRASAERLGDRRMGEMVELVSQFEVSNDYTQINYADRPVRTTPLEYGGFIKWLGNKANGVPAYINVDMVSQEVELVKLDGQGMKYVPSAYFGNNLHRHLRFKYPTKILGEVSFEIDDEGTPYYIVSVIQKTIFMFGGEDVEGIIILNPMDGSSTYYDVEDVPTWVDRVYSATMITEQLNWHGRYKSGWLNAQFGKKGVLKCTQGYNYLAIDDDIWLYTGFTSDAPDESNVGFMLVNMRTKEARYYACPGITEFSAMESAQGDVENFGYTATFPLLINVGKEPTYLMALKDSYSLVKMYALVNVREQQSIAKGTTLKEAFANYEKLMNTNETLNMVAEVAEVQGVVSDAKHVVKDGNSFYYIKLIGDENVYIASIDLSYELPFTVVEDSVYMTYAVSDNNGKVVRTFEKK